MRQAPEVSQCYYVTGAVDYVLLVMVADMADYEAFTRRHLFGTNVRRFETMVVMARNKVRHPPTHHDLGTWRAGGTALLPLQALTGRGCRASSGSCRARVASVARGRLHYETEFDVQRQ